MRGAAAFLALALATAPPHEPAPAGTENVAARHLVFLAENRPIFVRLRVASQDRPFASMAADYRRTGDGRFVWPAHFAGITREYCQIEKLANLDQLPRPHGFWVSCLPVKIKGASAGWCRAVALVPEEINS